MKRVTTYAAFFAGLLFLAMMSGCAATGSSSEGGAAQITDSVYRNQVTPPGAPPDARNRLNYSGGGN